MEKSGDQSQIEAKKSEDYTHKILFAAGTALFMACLKRSVILSFTAQWRWWVFVVLNLVLLAIVFMSMSSNARENQETNGKTDKKKEGNNKQRIRKHQNSEKMKPVCDDVVESRSNESQVEEMNGEELLHSISKDELNEKVEAFIVMFKKHLARDAIKGNHGWTS